jgi:hypothetical protein
VQTFAADQVHQEPQEDSIKFIAWMDTNWLGTAGRFDKPAPWNGKWSKPTVLYLEEGGFIFEHMRRWRQLGQSDADVEIRGPCFSACTLAVVPKERLCFGDYASLQFHAASDLSGRVAIPATMWMLRQYPRDIYDWLIARGGAPRQPGLPPPRTQLE